MALSGLHWEIGMTSDMKSQKRIDENGLTYPAISFDIMTGILSNNVYISYYRVYLRIVVTQ